VNKISGFLNLSSLSLEFDFSEIWFDGSKSGFGFCIRILSNICFLFCAMLASLAVLYVFLFLALFGLWWRDYHFFSFFFFFFFCDYWE
jgi:hypothetical protein